MIRVSTRVLLNEFLLSAYNNGLTIKWWSHILTNYDDKASGWETIDELFILAQEVLEESKCAGK